MAMAQYKIALDQNPKTSNISSSTRRLASTPPSNTFENGRRAVDKQDYQTAKVNSPAPWSSIPPRAR